MIAWATRQRVGNGAAIAGFLFVLASCCLAYSSSAQAATGINQQVNYQARLLDNTGAVVPDGTYNMEFKLYQDGNGELGGGDETLKWTETRTGGNKVAVKNGYFSVQLGFVNAFGTSVDWNQDTLWLSTNIGGTGTPTWDGEMSPFRRLGSSAYSFNSNRLGGLTASEFLQLAPGNAQVDSTTNNSIYLNKTGGSGNILQLQKNGSGVLTIANNGNVTVGESDSTGTLFVLDIKNDNSTDPSGTEGAMYYNDSANKFRCYQNTGWTDCIGTGGGGYATIQDETSSLTQRATLNFTGSGVSCVDNAGSSRTDCTINGGGSSTLQNAYDTGSAGDQVITLDNTQDSIVLSNPDTNGSDSTYVLTLEQLEDDTGTKGGLAIRNSGSGNSLLIEDVTSDNTPFIVDGDGRVGIGTTGIAGTTERLLQVGSETNRGNAAVYGELISKGMRDITALTNIKDIYIYDTSADSDGGRWIDWATTDKLSWFNETLDDGPSDPCNVATDDRCYAQAFPRKAVLIVTNDSLYIFDAQTNVMWMKFSQNAAGWALGADTNNDPSSVTAANGVIYVGTNGSSAGGLYAFDFTADRMWNYDDTDRSGADVGIGSRNAAVAYNSDNNTSFDIATTGTVAGWKTINDVSAAVIQNSATPIAATTGPNNGTTVVGLATDSGMTVINLSTQKVFQYSDATDNDYNAVAVTRTAKLYGLNETLGQAEMWINIDNENIATRVNGTPDKLWDEASTPSLSESAPTILANAPDALEVVERGSLADGGVISTATVAGSSDLLYVGTNQGLTEIHAHTTAAAGWSKFYNTTRQTAIMPATIRRMHMMDDASGNVTNQSNKTSIMSAKGTPTYGVEGVRGKAMSFNGTSQYLCSDANSDATCDNDTTDNMSTGSWTITAWFKHSTTISGTDVLFARCYNTTPAATAGCVAASMTSTGSIAVNVDYDATWTIGATGTTVFHNSTQLFNDNQWHFLAITRAATTGNINTMIDGKPIGQTAGLNTTLDAAQIWGIGTDCSTGAACATGGNFWDGSIDDFQFSANGGTGTDNNLTVPALHRLYNDARPLLTRKVVSVTDATTATSTTIGDSGETWIPNEFAGQIVTLTGGTGAGQTRHIVSNSATVITVSPAFTSTPDTTTDFEVDPESLFGATDSVTAIGITGESPLGEARQMCIGTNSGTDTGGVTCYNHNAGPNIIADVYHADAKQVDDSAAEWTGTDYDDVQSIDISGRAMVIGSMAHFWAETQDVRLGQGLDYLASKLFDVRNQVLNLGTGTLAGGFGQEIGLTGGADLAERYTSTETLTAGEIVALEPNNVGAVKKSTDAYQKDIIGIVATEPALVLGPENDQSYPIALVGRVPVKVTSENGTVKAGDRLTSSSTPGYAMKATQAGRVLGTVLDDLIVDPACTSPVPEGVSCGTVTVFVNLVDYNGSVTLALSDAESSGLLPAETILDPNGGLISGNLTDEQRTAKVAQLTQADKILRYLSGRQTQGEDSSEVLADNVSAVDIHGANIFAKNLVTLDFSAGGLTIDGTAHFNGDAVLKGHLLSDGAAPTLEFPVVTAPSTPTTGTNDGSDLAGQLHITFGQDAAAGTQFTVKFNQPYGKAPRVFLSPTNNEAAQLKYFITSTTDGFSIIMSDPPPDGLTPSFSYWVVE